MKTAGYGSQAALARAAGVSPSSVSRWLYDTGRPDIDGLRALAGALKTPEPELLAAAGYGVNATQVADAIAAIRPPQLPPVVEELVAMFAEGSPVPAQDREKMLTLIEHVIDPARKHMRRRRTA